MDKKINNLQNHKYILYQRHKRFKAIDTPNSEILIKNNGIYLGLNNQPYSNNILNYSTNLPIVLAKLIPLLYGK